MGEAKRKAISGFVPLGAPTFSATFVEKLTIKRFLEFARADIKHQFDAMQSESGHTKAEIAHAQVQAILIANYLDALKGGLEQMEMVPPPAETVN